MNASMTMKLSRTTSNNRHVLRTERRFTHPVEKVWRAISEPRELSRWWPLKIDELPLRQGAPLRFYDDGGAVSNGKITALEIGKVLAFVDENGEHEVRFELVSQDRGCLLVFTHSFPSDQSPAQHATGWHLCFEVLDAQLDGQPKPQLSFDPEVHRQYEEILGAGAASSTDTAGGSDRAGRSNRSGVPGESGTLDAKAHKEGNRWTLVMVREFKHPPEKIWEALTDPTELRHWAPFDAERHLGTEGPAILKMVGGPSDDPMDITVKRVVRPTLLEYTWGSDLLRWELQRTNTGTRLTLHHTLDDRSMLPKVAAGWHICFDVLERALDGQPVGRIVGGEAKKFGWERLNAEYATQFGVENTGWPEQMPS